MTDSAVFHPRRSGRDALRVLCPLGGIPPRRADEVIDLVDLTGAGARKSAATRWACGSAWPWPPPCWATRETLVLDEPANGLDPAGVLWLRTLLRGLADQGRTVLVSSHLLAEAGPDRRRRDRHQPRPAHRPRPDVRTDRQQPRHLAGRAVLSTSSRKEPRS